MRRRPLPLPLLVLLLLVRGGRAQQQRACPAWVGSEERAAFTSFSFSQMPIPSGAWVQAAMSLTVRNSSDAAFSSWRVVVEPFIFGIRVDDMIVTHRLCDVTSHACPVPLNAPVHATLWYPVDARAAVLGSIDIRARIIDSAASHNAPTLGCSLLTVPIARGAPSPPPPTARGPCVRPSPCARPRAPGHRDPYCSSYSHTFLPNASDCDGDGVSDHLCYDAALRAFSFISSAAVGGCDNADPPFEIPEHL